MAHIISAPHFRRYFRSLPESADGSTVGEVLDGLIEILWNRPEGADWFGGGYDDPGVHSICVDPPLSASSTGLLSGFSG